MINRKKQKKAERKIDGEEVRKRFDGGLMIERRWKKILSSKERKEGKVIKGWLRKCNNGKWT